MTVNIKRLEDIAHIETPPAPTRLYGQKAGRKCKGLCKDIEGFVDMRRIKFGPEMGFQKCTMCDCHFFKPDYGVCKCCGTRLRMKIRVRTATVKQKAQKFLMEISTGN
jgi:hypothetical protein